MNVKHSTFHLVIVGVASSLATVGVLELWRSGSPGEQGQVAESVDQSSLASRVADARNSRLGQSSSHRSADRDEHLSVLEARIRKLESPPIDRRRPVEWEAMPEPDADAQSELRDLVLGWVAEEREAQVQAKEDAWLEEQTFIARATARRTAEKYGLAASEEAKIVEILVDVEVRRRETELSFEMDTLDPDEFEARWLEFDNWADEHLREGMGPKLYPLVHDEDDE